MFRFDKDTLKEFDNHFIFEGNLETGIWVYRFKEEPIYADCSPNIFLVAVGDGGIKSVKQTKVPSNIDNVKDLIKWIYQIHKYTNFRFSMQKLKDLK